MSTRPRVSQAGLFSLGGVALVAGCSGGAISHAPGGASVYVPPAPKSTAKASVTLTIPARGASVKMRRAKYYSQGSTALGISAYPVSQVSPLPLPTYFSVPTPGPAPTTTTIAFSAPIGDDTVTATLYDANPSTTTVANALSTASKAVTIAPNATNTVTMTLQGIAGGVVLTANGTSVWHVLENVSGDQTVSVSAQPVDADGYLISGSLATAAPVAGTGGVTLSASSIDSASTLTATYPHASASAGTVTSSLPLNNSVAAFNVAVTPYYYAFVLDQNGGVTLIDPTQMRQAGYVATSSGSSYIAAPGGCSSAVAVAPAATGSAAVIISVPAPTTANPAPTPVATAAASVFTAGVSTAPAVDGNCNEYFVDSTNELTRISGMPSSATPTGLASVNATPALSVLGSNAYVSSGSGTSLTLQTVPIPAGGTPTSQPFTFSAGVGRGGPVISDGSALYAVNGTCVQSPQLMPLAGGSAITIPQVSGSGFEGVFAAFGTSSGYMYILDMAETTTPQGLLYYGTAGTLGSAPPSLNVGTSLSGIAMSPDQRFICILPGNGTAQFYRLTPAPVLAGTMPVPSNARAVTFGP